MAGADRPPAELRGRGLMVRSAMQTLIRLPAHPVPAEAAERERGASLRVEGMVARSGLVDGATLAALPRHALVEPFACEEGWTVPGLRWRGVRLADVLPLAEPLAEARYARVGAGDFVFPVALADAGAALLCDELDGAPLSIEHGAPWRLVLPGARCFGSVKWVDRLELAREPGPNTAEAVALGRLEPAR